MINESVLFVGLDPARMNLSGAPDDRARTIQAGIDASMLQLKQAGYVALFCALGENDANAEQIVRSALAERPYAAVVIGAGLRLLPQHTRLFEALVNLVVECAPGARLAFNSTPGDAAEAVRRQLGT